MKCLLVDIVSWSRREDSLGTVHLEASEEKQEIVPIIQIAKCHVESLKVKERLGLDIQIPERRRESALGNC